MPEAGAHLELSSAEDQEEIGLHAGESVLNRHALHCRSNMVQIAPECGGGFSERGNGGSRGGT